MYLKESRFEALFLMNMTDNSLLLIFRLSCEKDGPFELIQMLLCDV